LNDQPEKLVETLLERFDVNGVVPVTIDREKIRSIKDVSRSNGQEIYEYAYEKLLQEIYDTPPPRPASININTIAKRVTKHKL
jgi:hypothetical protein